MGFVIVSAEKEKYFALLLSILASLMVFFANSEVLGPMIQPDESSYLATAAAIAGFYNDMAGSYHAGYSILISPVFWFLASPQEAWVAVKIINAFLYFFTVALLWPIARRIKPDGHYSSRLFAVFLVACYPMWVVMVGYSFAQIAFVPVYLLMTLLLFSAPRGGLLVWGGLGFVSGFLYWVHPVGAASLLALVMAAIHIVWRQKNYKHLAFLLMSMSFMLYFYRYGVVPWLNARMSISGIDPALHYPNLLSLFSSLTYLEGLKDFLSRLGGHVFYLSIGSLGLIWVGVFSLLEKVNVFGCKALVVEDTGLHSVALFLILSLLGVLALSVLNFSSAVGTNRLDHWMYGRYLEGVIAPILLIGALSESWRKALWGIPISLISAFFLFSGLDSFGHTAPFNIPAFWQEFVIRDWGVWGWLASGVALILWVAFLPRVLAAAGILGVFLLCSFLQINYHNKGAVAAIERHGAALFVREKFPSGSCVGFDLSSADDYSRHVFWFDFGFVLFDYNLQRMSFDKWIEYCDGPFFSYVKNLDEMAGNIYPAAISLRGGPTLWMKGKSPALVYPMNIADARPSLSRVIGKGWHGFEAALVWSAQEAELKLPVPEYCRSSLCSVKLILSAYGASESRPVQLIIRGQDGSELLSTALINSSATMDVIFPLDSEVDAQKIFLSVPNAISPKKLLGANDERILGVALKGIELVKGVAPNGIDLHERGVSFSGEFLKQLSTQVGTLIGNEIISNKRQSGFLVYGPYLPLPAGDYRLQVLGGGEVTSAAWVDITSGKGMIQHAKFPLRINESSPGVLAEGRVVLNQSVSDIEVRIFVSEKDQISLLGYEFVQVNPGRKK